MKNSEQALTALAQRLRRHSILMTSEAGSGHPTTCMSCADIMSVLFFEAIRFDPKDPDNRSADAFVLSKGHAAPILYATLKEAGALDDDLMTLRKMGSRLEGHPMPVLNWVKVATGSLGQGLSAACGMALARKMDGLYSRVYCLMGDGETAEGSVWEAAQFAAFNKLDNLCAIVDVNALGQSGPTMFQHDVEAVAQRFRAFGWKAISVDGHSTAALANAFAEAEKTRGCPAVIVARTLKGKGVSFLEGKEGWHGKPLKKGQELDAALKEIGDPRDSVVLARPVSAPPRVPTVTATISVRARYEPGQEVATREAYGNALARLGNDPGVVVLDGDVKNSTFAEKFKAAYPDRYVEIFIAEQNMVGVALGMAAEGKTPFASSFACFLTRAYDQIRMAAYSRPRHLILCGSHAGVSIGEDGPSQMALEDIAMMRAVSESTVLYPCDAVSTEELVSEARLKDTPGVVYIRTTRPKTRVIYPADEKFPIGGSKVLRESKQDQVTVVAAGITVFEALAAHDFWKQKGVAVRVIDAYSVKPIDGATLKKAARETKAIITVEDHSACGGLGEAVAQALGGAAPHLLLAVRQTPHSATPKELMRVSGIDSEAIITAVDKVLPR